MEVPGTKEEALYEKETSPMGLLANGERVLREHN